MDALILAAAAALLLWLWIRRRRPGLFAPPARHRPALAKTMPRLGQPGTITEPQIDALQENQFTPSAEWSFEEAALILSALSYLRGVCMEILAGELPDVDVQNCLLEFILTDEDLRNYVRKWGADRSLMGAAADPSSFARNHQYERVARKLRDLTAVKA